MNESSNRPKGRRRDTPALVGGRFRLALVLLAVPLLATVVIGGAHLRSQLQYRAAVESASVDMARVILKDMFDVLFSQAGGDAVAVMNGAFAPAGSTSPDTSTVQERLAGMRAVIDSLGDDLGLPIAAMAVHDPTTDELASHGAAVTALQWRGRMGRAGMLSRDRPTRVTTVADEDDRGPYFCYFAPLRMQGRPPVILGLDVSLDRMGEVLIAPSLRAAERASLDAVGAGQELGVRVTHPSGATVFEQGRPGYGPTYALDLFGPDLASSNASGTRPFEASVSIPPELLGELIPGGLPGSPWPLVLAAVGIAVLLTGLAAVLLWRVRELVLMRERFVSAVSHELRTPLTQMLAYAETLELDRPTPNARRRAAGVIVRETRRLIHLVENTLDFVRGDADAGPEPETLDLLAAVRDIVDDLAALADARRATLTVEAAAPVHARADRGFLHRIVLNLVENALTYGPPGQTVTLTVRRAGDRAELLVDDQGQGVPEADRTRIWDAFERAHDTTGGTGLGLAIVRQLVEAQDGEVTVTDAPEGGARFVVRLPAAEPATPTAAVARDESPAAGDRRSPDPDSTDAPPRTEASWRAS